MQELSGRTALVTGASKGLGLYIVRALIKERMNVVLSGVSENELSQATTSFSQSGVKLLSVITDLTDRTAVETLVTSAIEEFGAIDVLVNNAGVETFFAYHNLCLDQIEYVIRVNLLGTMILTRLVLPGMLKRGQGHIVNMSSLSGKAGPPYSESYAATKAGIIAFTESLRSEYYKTGIGCSVICPGFVEAGIYQRVVDETGQRISRLLGTSSPEAVANAVVQAIKKDLPEIIINPGPTRLLTALAELSPWFGEKLMRLVGVVQWFETVAKIRQDRQGLKQKIKHS
jgi:short-subunit dehydrogenase